MIILGQSPRRPLRDAGFTLVEFLVVALVLGVIASVAVAADIHLRRPKTQVVFIGAPTQSVNPSATGAQQSTGQQPTTQGSTRLAVDVAAKSEVSMLGREVATYFVDGIAPLRPMDLTAKGGHYYLLGTDLGPRASLPFTRTATLLPGGSTVAKQVGHWCVQLTYAGGSATAVSYSAQNGLVSGACSATP